MFLQEKFLLDHSPLATSPCLVTKFTLGPKPGDCVNGPSQMNTERTHTQSDAFTERKYPVALSELLDRWRNAFHLEMDVTQACVTGCVWASVHNIHPRLTKKKKLAM